MWGGSGKGSHPPQHFVPLQHQLAHMRHDPLLGGLQVLLPRVGLADAGLVQCHGLLHLGKSGPRHRLDQVWAGCTRALGGTGLGPHLGLSLLSRSPPPLLLFAGPRRGLGCRVLGGCLGANPQVLAALYILELGPPQRLHCLILGPWGVGASTEGDRSELLPLLHQPSLAHPPTLRGLTIRFCSLIHCSLNSFRHFSISVRLAARGWQGGQMWGLPQGSPPSFCSPLPRVFHPLGPLPGLHSPPPTGSPPHPF